MHAIRQYEFGPPSTLQFEEVDDPHPAEGQVRIAVTAAGVHLLGTMIRAGQQGGPFPLPELPMTPGREVAGVVDAVGAGVDEQWLGKRVVAHLGQASGGYAELAVREVDALHELPDGLADDVAVAMIGTGRTTVGILETARLTSDDVVLVTGAAGGVGTLLVQAGRNAGATVVGLAGGPAKVERVLANSAQLAVDYTQADWPAQVRDALAGRDVTVVLDGVGGEPGRAALELLGTDGRLLLFGWSAGEPVRLDAWDVVGRGITVAPAVGRRLISRPGGLRELETRALAAAADGALVPEVSSKFPLAKAADAHVALAERSTVGKVLLIP